MGVSRKTIIIAVIAVIVGLLWYSNRHHEQAPVNKLVEVIKVQKTPIEQRILLLGVIHPKHMTTMLAKGSGLMDAIIPTGEKVEKGDLIARISNADVENKNQLSKSAVSLTQIQFERIAPLAKKGFVSAKELSEKKEAWINAQKEYAKDALELNNLRFVAPFNGIVGAYKKREGAEVNQGDIVVSVYDPAGLVVDFDIPCANLPRIHEHQKVYVLGKAYELTHIQKMLDEDTHMCPADVDIRCPTCLLGETVRVSLVVRAKPSAIVVPEDAVFLRNGQAMVYVVDNKQVKLKRVKLGIKQDDKVEITKGLHAGELLIIRGQERLYPEITVDVLVKKSL